MLTVACLALIGGLIARYLRLSALVAASFAVLAVRTADWMVSAEVRWSGVLMLLASLCALQGGFLVGSCLPRDRE